MFVCENIAYAKEGREMDFLFGVRLIVFRKQHSIKSCDGEGEIEMRSDEMQ